VALYEIVLSFPDCEASFFVDRRPTVGETLRFGEEAWDVVREDDSDFAQVAARFFCRSALS
jgi:hypothetical protein